MLDFGGMTGVSSVYDVIALYLVDMTISMLNVMVKRPGTPGGAAISIVIGMNS